MITTLGRQRQTDSCKSHRTGCLVSSRVGRRDLASITKKGKKRQKERKNKNMTSVLRMSPGLPIRPHFSERGLLDDTRGEVNRQD